VFFVYSSFVLFRRVDWTEIVMFGPDREHIEIV